jgi:7-keto-8-aminopelargonate synthetase-like enzyme
MPTLREAGSVCAALRHNDIDELERQIEALRPRHRRIWYAADGIYSMTGDVAPLQRLRELLDCYEELHLYIDDAHGMSWTGLHGRGTVIGPGRLHPRIVVALSLAKAFGAGGAALVFPDRDLARLVRTCGSTLIFSGQLQPALLGAGIASARIHLSPEILELQRRILERIDTFDALSIERGFELVSTARTPIRFVKVGPEAKTLDTVESLLERGFYTNGGMHPAVPRGQAGIRIGLSVHHTESDIRQLVECLSHVLSLQPRAQADSVEPVEAPS